MSPIEKPTAFTLLTVALSLATILTLPAVVHSQSEWETAVAPLAEKDYATAEMRIAAFLESHPEFADGHRMLGLSRMKQGKTDLARASLETAQQLGDASFATSNLLATLDLKQKHSAAAIERLTKFNPESLSAGQANSRGHLLVFAGSLEKQEGNSVAAFEAATLALDGGKLKPKVRSLGQMVAAGAALDKAIELEDRGDAAETVREWLSKGLAQLDRQKVDDSVTYFDLAGQLRQRLGQGERACQEFVSAFDLEPETARAKTSVSCYLRLQSWSAARDTAEHALERLGQASGGSDNSAEIHAQLARALHHLEEYDAAIANYRLAGLDHEAASLEQAIGARRTQEAHEARCSKLQDDGLKRLEETGWAKGTPEWKLIEIEVRR